MRIGMILDKTFPTDPRVENEAISLVNAGHEVYLFCLDYSGKAKKEDYKGFHIRRYSSNKIIYRLSALAYELPLYSWFMKPKIRDFIKENAIEAIHIHDIRIAGSVFKVTSKFHLPVILDLHDNYPEVMKAYPHLQHFPGKYIIRPKLWLRKEQKFIEKANYVICVSPEFAQLIRARLQNKHKVVLVPNTVRKSFYEKAILNKEIVKQFQDKFNLLYIGDTGIRRGLLTAINAMPDILQSIPEAQLLIVGKSSSDTFLKKVVKDFHIEHAVYFAGWQKQESLASYIVASDIGISPLYRSIQHDVAYANKLFQYMSLGLPVLVSDATAQKKLVQETQSGLVHEEKNSVDFARKVMAFYKDKNLYQTCSKNGRSFISQQFNWEKTTKKLIDLYHHL